MGQFSVRIMKSNGDPAPNIGVMIDYGIVNGNDERRTDNDGWVEFTNYSESSGDIWVHGKNMGSHSLSDGNAYSFTI